MATFITLVKMTDEGAKNMRNLPAQVQANEGKAWASRSMAGI
jgi:uncharacterized protein with GYD domain